MQNFRHALAATHALQPEVPVHVYRPHATEKAVSFFLDNFPGRVIYAVKTNPDTHVLHHLHALGVRSFDVASIAEVRKVRGLFPHASLYFMHTVKSRSAIKEAYFEHGVRDFSLDSMSELQKILAETGNATDLNLHIRLAIRSDYAELSLAGKFGAEAELAETLLRTARPYASRLGVCFHVGSQCMNPDAYRYAIQHAHAVVKRSGVCIESLDVGGGFPSVYPGMNPPAMADYFSAIAEAYAPLRAEYGCSLIAEPGRSLVAESGSVIVRVEHRNGNMLYINDGTYGSLFDAGSSANFRFPVQVLRQDAAEHTTPFSFYGPTCDALDHMAGPFMLPADIAEGDYIEVGGLGAYGRSLVTQFNGFTALESIITLEDAPLLQHQRVANSAQVDAESHVQMVCSAHPACA